MLTQGGGGNSGVVDSAQNLSADVMCPYHDQWSGKRPGTFSEQIMSKGVCDGLVPERGRSKPGRRAWSKLHYQEYLGERISVNPNRYKDFCVFALSRFIEKPFASASIFSILFLVFIFEALLLFKLMWYSSLSLSSPPCTVLFWNVFKTLPQPVETGDLGRGESMVVSDLLWKGSLSYQQVEIIHGKRDVINETLNCTVKFHHTSEILSFSTIMGKHFGD